MNYKEADKLLGKRETTKLCYCTILSRRQDNSIELIYHNTAILTFHPNNTTTIDCKLWKSVSTKRRLNAYLPHNIKIYTFNGEWHLYKNNSWLPIPYFNGVVIGSRGGISKQ